MGSLKISRRLLNAKKVIAELRAEVQRRDQPAPQQQHQQTADIHVSTHTLANIQKIWPGSPDDETEQMQHGLCLPSCRLSSEHTTRLHGNSRTEKGRLERTGPRAPRPRSDIVSRKRLRRYLPVISNMKKEGQLLPMKFEAQFYKWSIFYISPLTKLLKLTKQLL